MSKSIKPEVVRVCNCQGLHIFRAHGPCAQKRWHCKRTAEHSQAKIRYLCQHSCAIPKLLPASAAAVPSVNNISECSCPQPRALLRVTDTVQSGMPKKIRTLVDLEALLNDGSAYVLFVLLRVRHRLVPPSLSCQTLPGRGPMHNLIRGNEHLTPLLCCITAGCGVPAAVDELDEARFCAGLG